MSNNIIHIEVKDCSYIVITSYSIHYTKLYDIGGDYGKEELIDDFTEETTCLRGTDLPDMKTGLPLRAPVRYIKASKLNKCKLESGDLVIEISGGTEGQSTGRAIYT